MEEETLNYYSNCKERLYSHPVVQAFSKPKVQWIMSQTDLVNKKVLEIGAGNGYFSYQLMKYCNLTVLDISEHQLNYNPSKNKIIGSAYNLPFENNSFDIVICSNLLHHIEKPLSVINEMKRVSKRVVIFSEPNRNNPILFFSSLLVPHEKGTLKFSRKYLFNIVEKSGMKVKAHTYIGGFVMPNRTPTFLLQFSRERSTNYLSFFQIFICSKL